MRIVYVSRAHLTNVHKALQGLYDVLYYRGYFRTVDAVLNDWRNQAEDVKIRLNASLLPDLGDHATRCGTIGHNAELEAHRQRLIEYGTFGRTLETFPLEHRA